MVIAQKPPRVANAVRAKRPQKASVRMKVEQGLEEQMEAARTVMKARRDVLRDLTR